MSCVRVHAAGTGRRDTRSFWWSRSPSGSSWSSFSSTPVRATTVRRGASRGAPSAPAPCARRLRRNVLRIRVRRRLQRRTLRRRPVRQHPARSPLDGSPRSNGDRSLHVRADGARPPQRREVPHRGTRAAYEATADCTALFTAPHANGRHIRMTFDLSGIGVVNVNCDRRRASDPFCRWIRAHP